MMVCVQCLEPTLARVQDSLILQDFLLFYRIPLKSCKMTGGGCGGGGGDVFSNVPPSSETLKDVEGNFRMIRRQFVQIHN